MCRRRRSSSLTSCLRILASASARASALGSRSMYWMYHPCSHRGHAPTQVQRRTQAATRGAPTWDIEASQAHSPCTGPCTPAAPQQQHRSSSTPAAHLLRLIDDALALAAQVLHELRERRPHGAGHVHVVLVRDVLVVHDVAVHAAHAKAAVEQRQELLLELRGAAAAAAAACMV